MDTKKVMEWLLFVSLFFILLNMAVVYVKMAQFKSQLEGYSFSEGNINLTVYTSLEIQVLPDNISWGSGSVDVGSQNATLYTREGGSGVVLNGNWSGDNAHSFIIENVGTTMCNLTAYSGKTAHELFSSSSNSNEAYQWNVTLKEAGSCIGGIGKNSWQDAAKSPGTPICDTFDFNPSKNEIYLDVSLTVPYDAANIGEQSDTITLVAMAV